MGQVATTINNLLGEISTLKSQNADLKSQLTAAQAQPVEDPADLSAIAAGNRETTAFAASQTNAGAALAAAASPAADEVTPAAPATN